MTNIAAFNEKQIERAVERVHPLLVVAHGTARAPDKNRVREAIMDCIAASKEKEYQEQQHFYGYGLIVEVDRQASPWPTYTVYVPATDNWYLRPEEN